MASRPSGRQAERVREETRRGAQDSQPDEPGGARVTRDRASGVRSLPAPLTARIEAWLESTLARMAPLAFRDLRKGVQSLSTLYVEARGAGSLARRARESPARRGAFATYFATLHLLTIHHALRELSPEPAVKRVVDLGCGTGAAGAGAALAFDPPPRLLLLDRSGWALAEARHTLRALGLEGATRRSRLPAMPRLGPGDLVVLGWVLNECEAATRQAVARQLETAARRGARVLVAEPLAGFVAPWWQAFAGALAPAGLRAQLWKAPVSLPAWIARMDRAAGLAHHELGARLLTGPVR